METRFPDQTAAYPRTRPIIPVRMRAAYFPLVGALLSAGVLLYLAQAKEPQFAPISGEQIRAWIQDLSSNNAEHPSCGPFHEIRPETERRLWSALQNLSGPGTDELLFLALEKVYAGYRRNYLHGYIFHYPYLNSRKAIATADRILAEFPNSPHAPRALWLKAFALRVKPPDSAMGIPETAGDQAQWTERLEEARETYAELARRFPDSPFGVAARERLLRPILPIRLPVGPLPEDEDPLAY